MKNYAFLRFASQLPVHLIPVHRQNHWISVILCTKEASKQSRTWKFKVLEAATYFSVAVIKVLS